MRRCGVAIGAADGVAVHHRFIVGGRVDVAGDVVGEKQACGFGERHSLRSERRAMLGDEFEGFFDGKH